jgi:alkanesulfonate monooxygenase SsuD/methylene tetrahydromethanopterin reductase-like flavin-dependent oxidoreductase (luciferase family)
VELGIGLPNTVRGAKGEDILEWARRADAGPFASVGVFDRLVYDSLDPLLTLAAVAGVTRRVRLATTVVIGPLRNPVVLAKEAATLDVLSGGRLTLGLALGARRDDYDAAGIDYAERGRKLDEQLRVLRDAWEDGDVGPATIQPGGPELVVGGLDDAAFSRAARYADGFIHNGGPPRIFARSVDKAYAAWLDAGRPGQPRIWGMAYFALGAAEAAAGRDYLLDYYAFTGPFAERIADGLLTTPQAIVQHIRGYAEAGCDHLVLFPTSHDIAQLDRLADVVAEPSPPTPRGRPSSSPNPGKRGSQFGPVEQAPPSPSIGRGGPGG